MESGIFDVGIENFNAYRAKGWLASACWDLASTNHGSIDDQVT
jgi:hypothetical protein